MQTYWENASHPQDGFARVSVALLAAYIIQRGRLTRWQLVHPQDICIRVRLKCHRKEAPKELSKLVICEPERKFIPLDDNDDDGAFVQRQNRRAIIFRQNCILFSRKTERKRTVVGKRDKMEMSLSLFCVYDAKWVKTVDLFSLGERDKL